MLMLRTLAAAALLFGAIAPDLAANGRQPGSLLIFPVHRSGTALFTIICVTNTNQTAAPPLGFGGATQLHYQYFNVIPNPADKFQPLGCVDFDRREFLTPADTLCVLSGCHNAVAPGGQEGYLVVKAESTVQFQTPWSFNFLIGSSVVINASGAIYSTNAIPFTSPVANQQPTDISQNGRCELNGIEYESAPDELLIDSYVAVAESQLAIVNLTGDARDRNTLFLSIWNDNEFPLSASVLFNCWFDCPLKDVSPAFDETFLAGLGANDPRELDTDCDGVGNLETGWVRIDSIDVSTPANTFISRDGAFVGSITAGGATLLGAGHLLWESFARQTNGVVYRP